MEPRRLMALAYQFTPFPPAAALGTSEPTSMVTGSDGNVYFTMNSVGSAPAQIGELDTTTGAVSFTPTPSTGVDLSSIIDVGDALYFAEFNPTTFANAIGVFLPATHTVVEIPISIPYGTLGAITQGQDGNIYFTDETNNAIGEFVVNDPKHTVTEATLPKLDEFPEEITTAPDGLIFFGTYWAGAIGSYDPTTGAFAQAALPSAGAEYVSEITSFALGGDGRLYFSLAYPFRGTQFSYGGVVLGSIDPTATLSSSAIATYSSVHADSIAAEPDGNIAFTSGGDLGEFDVTTKEASDTTIPSDVYNASTVAAPGNGSLVGGAGGGLDLATTIPADQATIIGQVLVGPFGPPGLGINPPMTPEAGQLAYLDLKGDGTLDPGDPTAVTDADGTFVFNGVAPGTYTVRLATYPGGFLTATVPYRVGFVTAPSGGGEAVTVSGGQVATLETSFSLNQNSVLLPLAVVLGPFGNSTPDYRSAEVTAYYEIFYGRVPDFVGATADVSYLENGGSLQGLATAFLDSAEYETRAVAGYYTAFLGRSGSVAEVNAWVAAMQAGGLTLEQVAIDFLTSTEFNADHPDSTSFVQALYEDTLGRQPSAAELSAWDAGLAAGVTRAQAAYDVVYSTESLDIPLNMAMLLFDAWDVDLTPYVAAIQSRASTLAQAVAELASLPYFVQRANAAVPI